MTHDEVISKLESLARYWKNAARIKTGGKLVLEGDGKTEVEALERAVKMIRQHRVIASMFLEPARPAATPDERPASPMPQATRLQLATLVARLTGEGVSSDDMRTRMANVTGCAKSDDLSAESGAKCVRSFQTWLDELLTFRKESA